MIKGLAITPPVIGRISIGHLVQKGEITTESARSYAQDAPSLTKRLAAAGFTARPE